MENGLGKEEADHAAAGEAVQSHARQQPFKGKKPDDEASSVSSTRCFQLVSADKICQALRKQREEVGSQDPMQMFFQCMCETTRRLPLPYQSAIKREISEIVFRGEEQHFVDQTYRRKMASKSPSWFSQSPKTSKDEMELHERPLQTISTINHSVNSTMQNKKTKSQIPPKSNQ